MMPLAALPCHLGLSRAFDAGASVGELTWSKVAVLGLSDPGILIGCDAAGNDPTATATGAPLNVDSVDDVIDDVMLPSPGDHSGWWQKLHLCC